MGCMAGQCEHRFLPGGWRIGYILLPPVPIFALPCSSALLDSSGAAGMSVLTRVAILFCLDCHVPAEKGQTCGGGGGLFRSGEPECDCAPSPFRCHPPFPPSSPPPVPSLPHTSFMNPVLTTHLRLIHTHSPAPSMLPCLSAAMTSAGEEGEGRGQAGPEGTLWSVYTRLLARKHHCFLALV